MAEGCGDGGGSRWIWRFSEGSAAWEGGGVRGFVRGFVRGVGVVCVGCACGVMYGLGLDMCVLSDGVGFGSVACEDVGPGYCLICGCMGLC